MDAAVDMVTEGALGWVKPLGSSVWHLAHDGSRVRQPLCGSPGFAPTQRMTLENMKGFAGLQRCQECRHEAYRQLHGNKVVSADA